MDVNRILTTYDNMFGKNTLEEIEEYLVTCMKEARENKEWSVLFTLLNEIIGFCRDTTQKEKSLQYCNELLQLLEEMGLKGRIEYATALVNVTNAYRAFGLHEESLRLYEEILYLYKEQLDETDFRFASLYNNWSLLYQETGEFQKAKEMLQKALVVVDSYEDEKIKQAVTRANLAATLLHLNTEEDYKEAIAYLKEALHVFENGNEEDFHYGAALVAMGDAYTYQKEYAKAADFYRRGLMEIEKHVGKTDNYVRVHEKLGYVSSFLPKEEEWISNLQKSRLFYEEVGKPMIQEQFPEYASRIAVGLVGEGSDCFGFDDEISTDHDYAIGFCMWLTKADYEKIGKTLQAAYDQITHYDSNSQFIKGRRGVFCIDDFYNNILETRCSYEEGETPDYGQLLEHRLATATNGEVFTDDLGYFSKIRNLLLDYYPENLWRQKLAQVSHEFSQYAQSNYPRMMARKDWVTAGLCVAKALESAMDMAYLLSKRYAPYYKWKKRGLENIPLGKKIVPLMEKIVDLSSQKEAWKDKSYSSREINGKDEIILLFEEIAAHLLKKMRELQLIDGKENFPEYYIEQIIKGKNMDVVERIVELEWAQFDKVKNEGGRADCQNNFNTFSIMRKSQYLCWTRELLESFLTDLQCAQEKGWNLIMEKYARMMKSTAPEKYVEFEKDLPGLSPERIAIQEEIIKIQVGWMEEFAAKYPKMALNARYIHTKEDTAYNTSYETYLRGELGTYSETTFILYGRFITDMVKEERNLAYEIMNQTARLYGYQSVEDAEAKL